MPKKSIVDVNWRVFLSSVLRATMHGCCNCQAHSYPPVLHQPKIIIAFLSFLLFLYDHCIFLDETTNDASIWNITLIQRRKETAIVTCLNLLHLKQNWIFICLVVEVFCRLSDNVMEPQLDSIFHNYISLVAFYLIYHIANPTSTNTRVYHIFGDYLLYL